MAKKKYPPVFTGKTGEEILAERKATAEARAGVFPTGEEILAQRKAEFKPIEPSNITPNITEPYYARPKTEPVKGSSVPPVSPYSKQLYDSIQGKTQQKKPVIPEKGAELPPPKKPLVSGGEFRKMPEKPAVPIDLDIRPLHEIIQEKAKKPTIPMKGAEKPPASVPRGEIKAGKVKTKPSDAFKRFLAGTGVGAGAGAIERVVTEKVVDPLLTRDLERKAKETGSDAGLRYYKADKEYWDDKFKDPNTIRNLLVGKKADYEPTKAERFAGAAGEFAGTVAELTALAALTAPLKVYKGTKPVFKILGKMPQLAAIGGLSQAGSAYSAGADSEQILKEALKGAGFFMVGGAASEAVGIKMVQQLKPVYEKYPQYRTLLNAALGAGRGLTFGVTGVATEAGISKAIGDELPTLQEVLKTGFAIAAFDMVMSVLTGSPFKRSVGAYEEFATVGSATKFNTALTAKNLRKNGYVESKKGLGVWQKFDSKTGMVLDTQREMININGTGVYKSDIYLAERKLGRKLTPKELAAGAKDHEYFKTLRGEGRKVEKTDAEAVFTAAAEGKAPQEVRALPEAKIEKPIKLGETKFPETIKIKKDPTFKGEATVKYGEGIILGEKFFNYDAETKKHILYHEAGHLLSDLNRDLQVLIIDNPDNALGEFDTEKLRFEGIFGETKPEEAWCEAYKLYHLAPQELKSRYPKAYNFVDNVLKLLGEDNKKLLEMVKDSFEQEKAPELTPAEKEATTISDKIEINKELSDRIEKDQAILNAIKNSDKQNALIEIRARYKAIMTEMANTYLHKGDGYAAQYLFDRALDKNITEKRIEKIYDLLSSRLKKEKAKESDKKTLTAIVKPYGREGRKVLKKWAANESVSADLTDDTQYVQDFIRFFETYYNAGVNGQRIIDVKLPEMENLFPPFLEEVFFQAGKKDAANMKKSDKGQETTSVTQKQEFKGEQQNNIVKDEEAGTPRAERDLTNKELLEEVKKIIMEDKEEKKNEQADKVRADGEGALEGVQTQDVPGVAKEGETKRGVSERTETDERRDVGADRAGDGLRQGVGDGEREVHSSSERGGSTESITGVVEKEKKKPVNPKGQNVTIKKDIELGGEKQRARDNIEAIKLMLKLEKEGRPATKAEQEVLLKYVGWGGLSNVTYTDYSGKPHRDWVDEHNELKSLVSAGEFQAIRESTLNAHYTSISVIKAMYEGLKHFGFKGGKILEPSMGIGHFFGAMPQDMAHTVTVLTGVELDSITGRIAKQLYPLANIHIKGFEETNLPDNYYDVAISNVPFGDYGVVDKRYPNYVTGSIHNYFFAKGLDKVRPGGLVMFITSRYTMDSKNGYQMRKYLADRADFLGAIRLPNTAFKANAKTEVVTDIIILRKREPHSNYNGESFLNTKPYKINDRWGNPRSVDINEYFAEHPEMVLGEPSLSGSMYRGNEYTVLPKDGTSLPAEIKKAFNKIKGEMVYPDGEKIVQEQEQQMIPAPGFIKNGAFAIQNGKIYVKNGEYFTLYVTNTKTAERIKGLIAIRDEVRRNLQLQLSEAEERVLTESRNKLNRLYDSFVKKYGYIHSRSNHSAFGDDPDYPLLQSIEKYDEATKDASKSDIFFKNTITPYKRAESAETGQEALIISLNEEGRVNLHRMEELTGRTQDELVKELEGLIFKVADGTYETAEKYLSGNVRQKLRDAEALAAMDPSYTSNVEALKRVQPKDKTASEIKINMGVNWIPAEIYKDFISTTFSIEKRDINISYVPILGEWKLDISAGKYSTASISEYGTPRKTAYELLERIMNNKKIDVRDTDEDGKTFLNKAETLAAQEKAEKIKDEFMKWLWQDEARKNALVELYNEKFNNINLINYDGSHLELPGHNPAITFRPHQKNAIWRILSSGGNTLLAHKVGAGKSGVMFGAAMELKRMGIVKKPLMVFPNHLVGQMGKEFLMFYPGANILVATKKDFEKSKRKVFLNRIATGNYDAVLIGQSQFGMIPMSKEFITEFYQEQIDLLESLIKTEAEAGYRSKRSAGEKQLAKAVKRLKVKMQKLTEKTKKDESVVTFEELGVDSLFVDEAHDYKNLMYATNMTNVSGLGSKDGSGKAFDLYMKVQYLQKLNGGRGIVFATATPVMNTMAEMYTMQRYLQPDVLKDLGLEGFDAWASAFGKVVTVLEMTPEGKGFRQKESFAKFINMTNLSQLFRSFADVLLDVPGLKLPTLKGGKMQTVIVEPSEALTGYIDSLVERAQLIRERKVEPTEDNMLKITSDGRKAALDMRLIDPNLPDYPHSKVNAAVDNVFRIWQETKKDKLTQIVFLDLSTPKAKKNKDAENEDTDTDTSELSVYDDIKNKLIIKGIPEKEIAFIHDADTDAKKLALFEKMNTGKIRVLIGSTNKMGTGMNVQRLCKAMHHLDCPWRPGDIEQRNGRIVRQGNLNEEVEIYAYVTESSFDARMWDSLTRKQRFIEQALTSQLDEVEDVGEMTLSFQEIAAIASGNPLIQEQVVNAAEVNKLLSLRQSHFEEQINLERKLKELESDRVFLNNLLRSYKADLKVVEDTSGDRFKVEINGAIYHDRKKAGEILLGIFRKDFKGLDKAAKLVKVGRFAGLNFYISGTGKIVAKGGVSYETDLTTDGPAMFRGLTAKIGSISKEITRIEEKLSGMEEEEKKVRSRIGLPFEKEDELKKALLRKTEIETALNPDESVSDVVDDGETEDIDNSVSEGMPAFAEKPQRISSADTSINSQRLPAVFSKVKWKSGTINADLGGGKFDNATIYLSKLGVENLIWDPYNRDATHNAKVQARIQGGQADTATVSNVLNVIAEEEARLQVIENAADVIKPSGVAYFTIYEGDGSGVGKETSKGFQLNKKTKEYIPEIQEFFGHVILRNGVIEARVPKKESIEEGLTSKLGQNSIGNATGKNVSGKAKRPSEIVKQFEQRLKATIKKGGVHWTRLGEFNNRTYIIRIAKANDIATLAHEVGHYFDKLYDLTTLSTIRKQVGKGEQKIVDDLMHLGKPTSRASYSKLRVRREGIAEFFRKYFTDSARTAEGYPELTDYVKSKVPREVMGIVEEIAQDIWDLVNLDPVARGLKQIHFKGDPRSPSPFSFSQFLRKIYAAFADENYPLEWAAGEMAGEKFKEEMRNKLSALRGWEGIALTDIFGDYQADLHGKKVGRSYKQIMERVHETEQIRREYQVYKVARRSEDYFARGKEMPDSPETYAEQIRILELKYPWFKEVFAEERKFDDNNFDLLVQAGLYTAEEVEAIKLANPNHVPLQRIKDAFDYVAGTSQKLAGSKNVVKGVKGSGEEIQDPEENMINNVFIIRSVAMRNKLGVRMAEIADKVEGKGYVMAPAAQKFKMTQFNLNAVRKYLYEVFKEEEGIKEAYFDVKQFVDNLDLDIMARIFQPQNLAGLNQWVIYKDGEPVVYDVHPDVYQAVKGLSPENMNLLTEILMNLAQIQKAGIIYTPKFIARNFGRDTLHNLVASQSGINPIDIAKGVYSVLTDDKWYKLMARAGGTTNYFTANDRKFAQEAIDEIAAGGKRHKEIMLKINTALGLAKEGHVGQGAWYGSTQTFNTVLKILQDWIEPSEMPGRVAEAKKTLIKYLKAVGYTNKDIKEMDEQKLFEVIPREEIDRAIRYSRDLSVDFRKMGGFIKQIQANRLINFLNPSIQGPVNVGRLLVNPKTRWRTIIRGVLYLTLPSMFFLWLNWENENFHRAKWYWRDMFFLIPIGDPKTTKFFFPVPRPWELGIMFAALPERLVSAHLRGNPDAWDEFDESIKNVLLPDLMPSALEPLYRDATGKDWRGVPIINEGDKRLSPHLQYNEFTSIFCVKTADALKDVPGIPEFMKSPKRLQRVIEGYTGTLGHAILEGIDITFGDKPGVPILGAIKDDFVLDSHRSSRALDKFYNYKENLDTQYADAKRLEQELPADIKALRKAFNAGANIITIFNDSIQAIRRSDMPQKQKDLEIAGLRADMLETAWAISEGYENYFMKEKEEQEKGKFKKLLQKAGDIYDWVLFEDEDKELNKLQRAIRTGRK